ncbi:MAG: hypothetical protein FWG98_14245 [Candidatus Cloacimonetes bacterium]|nr:hypothetical protein [Candidatus Cloacimonadota bacterium]
MEHFNTAGPVNQPEAYKIDPLTRWNTEEILGLIQENLAESHISWTYLAKMDNQKEYGK